MRLSIGTLTVIFINLFVDHSNMLTYCPLARNVLGPSTAYSRKWVLLLFFPGTLIYPSERICNDIILTTSKNLFRNSRYIGLCLI